MLNTLKTDQNYLLQIEENYNETKKFKALNDFSMDYSFRSLPYEVDLIKKDSALGIKEKDGIRA